jgi:PAS domain S-box-containing protein
VITHTTSAVVLGQTADLRRATFLAASILLVFLATISYVLARHQLRRGDAERRIRLSESRFRDLLESAPDGIIILDAAGRIDLVNVQVERQFGYPRHELVGESIEKLIPGQLRNLIGMAAQGDAAEREPPKPGADLRGTRKDGSEFPVWISFSPTRTDNGLGLFCDVRDVSAQRATERRIQELNRRLLQDNAELEALNREMETFSYSVSHDLRAPLRAITGFSQALQEDSGDRLNPDGRTHLERLRQAAQRMELLIEDLLALARVSRSEINKTSVNVSDLARDILGDLAAGDPRRQARAEITPGLRASADPRLLRIALENLLGNAWKFTRPSDPAAITVGQEMTAAGPAFFVRDNGVGFDMTRAAGLFRPFHRLHEGRQFPGTGIGLATAQRVILRHGGQIWARSRPGEGAIFYFTLQ